MILRIVKMEVAPDKLEDFKRFMTNLSEEKIKQKGCVHHDFFSDKQYDNVYFQYTIWERTSDLKKYKSTPLFKEVVKTLSNLCLVAPYAWTVENVFNKENINEK